ncbi:plasmid stability protein [Arthrobacter pigmenti]|uniref:Plasmid stability protein n=1 Tax=Arthrobacter pigmenti TaxID=271432 RepID=A0A846RLT2_9MICC|nr:hypothetical protein [Arthrobacter pigmenti]NJC22590.1 plasmid stability protein [Arthrobacter pigmenti]
MPNISIRDVDQHTADEIKRIAASNGRSMQVELRLLLRRFADLPWESQLANYPVAMIPLPRWYTDLQRTSIDFVRLSPALLPPRRSAFRLLDLPAQSRDAHAQQKVAA